MPLKGYVGGANAKSEPRASRYQPYPTDVPPMPETAAPAADVTASAVDAPRQRRLYLKLSRPQMDDALKILSRSPGGIRVMLYIAEEKKTLAAPVEFWVNEDFDRAALEAMLGKDAVVMK